MKVAGEYLILENKKERRRREQVTKSFNRNSMTKRLERRHWIERLEK
jgi:hypothetical protein